MTVSTKFYEIFAPYEGVEVTNIIGGAARTSGYIRQIFISCLVGGGSFINFQVRYHSEDFSTINLVCSTSNAELPEYAGLNIDAPFDLKNKYTNEDLILYLKPEADGVFKVRIDFDFDRI